MTSSLVGSEMCIRDRDYLPAFDPDADTEPDNESAMANDDEYRSMLTMIAVSYTHLTLPTICSV
eukprot:1925297-Prorocentrum_lima.AAC.1